MPAANPPNADPAAAGSRRALITGGAGFIGSHLAEWLVARGDQVTVLDDLSTGRRENLGAIAGRVRFIEGDAIETLPALEGERFDGVYHLAAAVGVERVLNDPIGAIETNIDTTAAVLKFAHRAGGGPADRPAVLVASSSEVYGKPTTEVFSEENDVVFGPTSATRWSYAQTKTIDEHLAMAYHRLRGVRTVIARFFNIVGPRQVGDYGMVLPRFVARAIAGEPIEVYGDGGQSRCFCDVRDLVPALPELLATDACHGRVFNLGGDQPITMLDLARRVKRALGSNSPVTLRPYEEVYAPGFEDLRRRRPDLARVRSAIVFEPKIGLDDTIRDLASEMAATGDRPAYGAADEAVGDGHIPRTAPGGATSVGATPREPRS